jgi:hypothetical protein
MIPLVAVRKHPGRVPEHHLDARQVAWQRAHGSCGASLPSSPDEDLAYKVGTVHDYVWHRRHRARRGGQLVDIAILVTLAAMVVSSVLMLHH